MFRIVCLVIFFSIIFSCDKEENKEDLAKQNRLKLISTDNDSIPIVEINYSKSLGEISKKVYEVFDNKHCEYSPLIIRLPIFTNEDLYYVDVLIDTVFECVGPMNRFCSLYAEEIQIYPTENIILYDNEIIEYKEIKEKARKIYELADNEGRIKNIDFNVHWKEKLTPKFRVDSTLNEIVLGYTEFINNGMSDKGLKFEDISNKQIDSLKNKYPLRIRFFLFDILPPPPLPGMESSLPPEINPDN